MIILELKTAQSTAIKVVIDAINSLLNDANFDFYPNIINSSQDKTQTGGIILKEINKTGKILVYMKLDADKFDVYNYNYHKDKLTLGIDINNLLKCLKCMSHYDTMSWIVDDDDINKLIIILESSERKEKKTFKLKYESLSLDFKNNLLQIEKNFSIKGAVQFHERIYNNIVINIFLIYIY